MHDVRPESEPFHHAGAKALDQRIGAGQEIEHLRDGVLVLQVELDDLAAASGHRFQALPGADAVERDHLGAHVGKHHAGEWTRTDAGEFDDAIAGERAGGADGSLRGGFVEHLVTSQCVSC